MPQPLQNKHRLWAEIDLGRLTANYITAKNSARGKVMPVIKADAYGHGAVRAALALRAAGADFFAVATPEEALQLRRHGVDCHILLLGAAPVSHLPALAAEGVTLCVPDAGTARLYKKALKGRPADAHIKFDTGMTRLGLPYPAAVKDALEIAESLNVTGLFTHFPSADDPSEDASTRAQFDRFMLICGELRERGLKDTVLHAANSAALTAHPYSHLDYARPGLMLYGYSPRGAADGLRPVLSLYSSIMQCHAVPAGTAVGYGRTWTAGRESVIATVPVGYADGLSRALSSQNGRSLISLPVAKPDGRSGASPAPLIGRVSMDFCALDVTDIPGAAPGDLVTVLGDGIDAADHARLSGAITWEALCSIGRRVPRVYRQDGKIIEETNDLDRL